MNIVLGEDLVSYQDVIEFLKSKGKGKNFFDTLRTRHKLIHKPIIRKPIKIVIKELGINIKPRRNVFYLSGIISYLEEIIRLHDSDKLSFKEIEKEMAAERDKLNWFRELELADDKRLKTDAYLDEFEIAKNKLKLHYGWADDSKDMLFLNYISNKRLEYARRYHVLTNQMAERARKSGKEIESDISERRSLGENLDFYHNIIEATIKTLKDFIESDRIKMKLEDYRR